MNRVVKYCIFSLIFLFSCFQYVHCKPNENYCAYSHFLNAELERLKGNNEKVIQEYEEAIKCDPSSFYLRKGLITFLISQNQIEPAKTLLEETTKKFPDKDLELVLAHIYKNGGRQHHAMRIAKKVLKQDPENQRANYLLFTLFLGSKKWEEAEKYAQKLIEFIGAEEKENLKNIYVLIGMEYARAENFDEGFKYFKKAQAISPDNPEIHMALGTFYENDGKFEEASKEYEKALSLSPFSLVLYYRLGEVYSQLGRTDEAISIYEKALQLNNIDYLSSTNLARIYYKEGNYQKGFEILKDYPIKDFYLYYLLGTFLVRLDRLDEARENIKKSIQLAPKSYASYLLLINIYGEEDRKDEALALLNNASEKALLSEDKLYLLFGIVYSQSKDYKKSIDYLRKANNLTPDDDMILFQLGASYERNKDWFRAVYYLKKAIKLNPENAEALNYLGYMFAEKGTNLNEAAILIERALQIQPRNGYFVDSLGWVYYQKGFFDEALKELNKAIEFLKEDGEDDPIIREHLGDVYYKQGNLLEAKEQWKVSISLDSAREEVRKKLEDLKIELGEK